MRNSKLFFTLFFCFFCTIVFSQNRDSVLTKLSHYIHAIDNFSKQIPQEKVYLHFDNTSYYQGDDIWFKCYLETSKWHTIANLSKTLYVDLLNPGGEVIKEQVLKIENGQCHGNFTLDGIPFYSGFYEVRAYTKYMLNFGEDIIFSRILPVFDKPEEEGDFEEKTIQRYTMHKYPLIREKPDKGKRVNLKFYPEGGNLIQGITSEVAFEATDAYGNPIEVAGSIVNKEKEEVAQFTVTHNGRGVFSYTPPTDTEHKAIVHYKDKKYKFNMPIARANA